MNKIYFQGTFGAYSHLAALSIYPNAEILPCKTFDECFARAAKDSNSKIIIESNRLQGILEYLIFQYRLNIYSEYFQKLNIIYWYYLDQRCLKLKMYYAQALSQCSNFIKLNNLIEHVSADTAVLLK